MLTPQEVQEKVFPKSSGIGGGYQMMQNLSEQMYRYRYEYVKDVTIHGELVREHRAMLESIEKKDLEEAVKTVKNHISKQGQAIIRNLNLEEMENHE